MNEYDIQNFLHNAKPFIYHDGHCPNVCLYSWESDFVSIARSGYVHECEIKISRSDYKNDFINKKGKHQALATGRADIVHSWYIKRKGERVVTFEDKEMLRPNYFWFVCPEGIINADEVPEYAGLIYAGMGFSKHIIKKAPKLHREKTTDSQREHIIRSFQFKYWSLRMEKNK